MKFVVAILVISTGVWVGASQQAPLAAAAVKAFEEASVRPCDPDNLPPVPDGARGGGANSFQMTPGKMHAQCITLATLIRTAYGYGPAQLEFLNPGGRARGLGMNNLYGLGVEDGLRVRGGPDWVRSDRYSVDAIAEDTADALSMSQPMLRALLEQRFKLKAHVETEQIPAFNLVIAPSGLTIKPASADSCERPPTIVPGQPFVFRPTSFADVRRGAKPTCGATVQFDGPNHVLVTGEATVEGIGRSLVGGIGKPQVFDRTGNTDKFNIVVEFTDRDAPPPPPALVTTPIGPVEPAPEGRVVLEQLGLRLEPAKTPRDYIQIDSVERPTVN